MKPLSLLFLIVFTTLPLSESRGQTNQEKVKAIQVVTIAIAYDFQSSDSRVVTFNNGQNRIVVYGLPSTFSDGDTIELTLYPAGEKVIENKKYHAYSTTKDEAQKRIDAQKMRIDALKKFISNYQAALDFINESIELAVKKGHYDGGLDSSKKDTATELATAQDELAGLQ